MSEMLINTTVSTTKEILGSRIKPNKQPLFVSSKRLLRGYELWLFLLKIFALRNIILLSFCNHIRRILYELRLSTKFWFFPMLVE